jgi:hypothetical protein
MCENINTPGFESIGLKKISELLVDKNYSEMLFRRAALLQSIQKRNGTHNL